MSGLHSPEEIAARGNQIYRQTIRPQAEDAHSGKVIAIDVTSGDYAIGNNVLTAADLLREKRPDAVVWLM